MRESGVSAVVAEVYNGSNALFRSRRLPVRAEWLESFVPLASAAGLEVHGWMWCMPCLLPDIIRDHPGWYNVNAKGESAVDKPAYVDYYKFLDPAQPEVREFVRDTVSELADVPGLTLTLDYTHFTRKGMPDSAVEPLVPLASHFHARGASNGRLQTSFDLNSIDYGR